MRTISGCLILVAASVLNAPSSEEFHNRYGEADQERFTVRPGISLTVQYGSDHLACQAFIAPTHPLIPDLSASSSFMSSETVTEILEEIAPSQMRGKKISESGVAMGCKNENQVLEYESVVIVRSEYDCLPLKPQRERLATVAFTREACPKTRTLFNLTHSAKPIPGNITYAVSGSFKQGYTFSSDSTVVIDTKTGLEVDARVMVIAPDNTIEKFIGKPVYNTDRMWQWQGQGSLGGSLDFQDQRNTFVGYSGGMPLTNSAYDTPSLGHIITSTDTFLKPIASPKTSP
jgi:hypothetical protein